MKKNIIKYGLIAIVLVVWAGIFQKLFKLYGTTEDSEIPIAVTKLPTQKKTKKEPAYTLNLDYPNPFNLKTYGYSSSNFNNTSPVNQQPILPRPIPRVVKPNLEDNIDFKGVIKNLEKKEQFALVAFNQKSKLLSLNDSIHEYKLIQITQDSIILQKGSEKKPYYYKKYIK